MSGKEVRDDDDGKKGDTTSFRTKCGAYEAEWRDKYMKKNDGLDKGVETNGGISLADILMRAGEGHFFCVA